MAIHKMVSAISKGEEFAVFGDGNQTRDFTYVSDVVEANLSAAKNEVQGMTFNIGGGSRISMNDLIKLISNLLNEEAKIAYIEEQRGDVRHTLANVELAAEKLGWQPRVEITEGLHRYIDSIALH
jgi:UDP-glucose 4-epimerase